MDWKLILNTSPEELTDNIKDELYDKIAWFSPEENLSQRRLSALFRVSQTLLKYKGEQVETLLHELDELATKQGEEEARKSEENDSSASSPVKKRTTTIEFENLEHKFMELKTKYKKQVKLNEKLGDELRKFTRKIGELEVENRQLHDDIKSRNNDGSETDLSESARDHRQELMETIQGKNKQISDLLQDIEEVEKDNSCLRKKLTGVRDELSKATQEITSLNDLLQAKDLRLEEQQESYKQLKTKEILIQEELLEALEQKQSLEDQLKDFTEEINKRIDDWKAILEDKDAEIQRLRVSGDKDLSIHSSVSSLPNDDYEKSSVPALMRTIADRDDQLLTFQIQLRKATKDMEANTELIDKAKGEKLLLEERLKELTESYEEVNKNLHLGHERCQNLQEEVNLLEQTLSEKDQDLKDLVKELQSEGYTDLSGYIKQIQTLRVQKRLQEKQLMNTVKSTNKLQETFEILEKENCALRQKLGLSEDDFVNITGVEARQKTQRKELDSIKAELIKVEEEKLTLRMDLQKMTKTISLLSNQLLDSGVKPIVCDYKATTNIEVSTNLVGYKEELKFLSEENEALRHGMHEILNSINNKKDKSLTEIKSETFEKLLRALDVKHVSGWYHPAMRLQAELHHLEGVNTELREQMRQLKLTPRSISDHTFNVETPRGCDDAPEELTVDEPDVAQESSQEEQSLENDRKDLSLQSIKAKLTQCLALSESTKLHKHLKTIQEHLDLVFNDKQNWDENLQRKNAELQELQQNHDLLQAKLQVFTENQSDDSIVKKLEQFVEDKVLNERKITYLKIELEKVLRDNELLKADFRGVEAGYKKELNELVFSNRSLLNKVTIAESTMESLVCQERHQEVVKNLENITIKYRDLMDNVKSRVEEKLIEISLLQESLKLLEQEKLELKSRLEEALQKPSNEEDCDKLPKQLAESQVNEITERQRANHTNNLYELVKEQLQKSEERFKEFSRYNEDIMHKNLLLQEQLRDAETKLIDFVDLNVHKQLQNVNNELLKETERLQTQLEEQKQRFIEWSKPQMQQFPSAKEQELLNLKHQIVDLIANCDDKMQIALLHNDMQTCRKLEAEQRHRFQELTIEFASYKERYKNTIDGFEREKLIRDERNCELQKKLGIIQDLLFKQKLQFLGCPPMNVEEKLVGKLLEVHHDKHETFMNLHKAKLIEKDCEILKEQSELELKNLVKLASDKDEYRMALNWMQDKKSLQLNELRYRRQAEFKETQLVHLLQRIQTQDEQIARLEEELLLSHKTLSGVVEDDKKTPTLTPSLQSKETQTEDKVEEFKALNDPMTETKQLLEQYRSRIAELEVTVAMLKKQIGDKQSQITFYERHILELQSKQTQPPPQPTSDSGGEGDNINVGVPEIATTDELLTLKATIQSLQETLAKKETEILEYQSLLKEDRDKHSLAAERLQEELKTMQLSLAEEKQKHAELEEFYNQSTPNLATIDQYMNQVNTLEKHIAELHTKVTSLEAQLESSRQEAIRWRDLANDRLQAMEQLRASLESQHQNELLVYKTDSEKWRSEVNSLRDLMLKHRNKAGSFGEDVKNILKDKDTRISELMSVIRQTKLESKDSQSEHSNSKNSDLDAMNETLQIENESLKKRYTQLLARERTAREEIRELKGQLIKKSSLASRTDKTEKSIKDQLQRKITVLEAELDTVKDKLSEQLAMNDCHKIKISEDFERWKKQKHWQQSMEKLKNKLKERDLEFEKLQQTCSSYRVLIERLEREKNNLETRVKTLKRTASSIAIPLNDYEILKLENAKLLSQLEVVHSKLEMQKHHSGSLSTALLQEKLQAQEKKIAILEMTPKGSLEVRQELERQQTSIGTLQKKNLCLEAENLDLKLDLEKSNKEMPHLRQQIQHLENYIEVLKGEMAKQRKQDGEAPDLKIEPPRKVSELERTVFVLKRVVEKLQTENKRLLSGKRPCSARTGSAEKLKRDLIKLKEQYSDLQKKNVQLEHELLNRGRNKRMDAGGDCPGNEMVEDDLVKLKEQLDHKTQLLDKVKVLLHRAAVKEKTLLKEIADLKDQPLQDSEPSSN